MSIRLRLTLLYSTILALTLILFGVALYNVVAQVTLNAAQDRLKADATNFVAELRPFAPSPPPLSLTDIFIQIRRLDGDVVVQSSNLPGTLPLDPSMLPQILAGPPGPEPAVVTIGGQQLLLYNTDFTYHGQVLILQVARPLRLIDQPLAIVRRVLLIGGGHGASLPLCRGVGR